MYCKKCDKMVMSKVKKQCPMYDSVAFLTHRLISISFMVISIIGGIICAMNIGQYPIMGLPTFLCFFLPFVCVLFLPPCVV